MKDIVPELLKRLKKDYEIAVKGNIKLKDLESKIIKETITYADANEYAKVIGDITAKLFRSISSEDLPDGKMYYNIAKRTVEPIMQECYEKVAKMSVATQTVLNKNAHIGIKAIKPGLNQDRIDGILNRISSEADFNDVKWILDEPVKVFARSIVDEAVKNNAEFHYKAGMMPKIVRKTTGKACKWCQEVAGSYVYPNVPKDVYRRHDNCTCIVEYFPGDGKKQNVWSKKWKTDNDIIEKRKTVGLDNNQRITYNNSPTLIFDAYQRSIKIGELTPLVDYKTYVNVCNEIEKKLIGIKTANGIQVASRSDHFVARVFGSLSNKRNGVNVDDILNVLQNPTKIFPIQTRNNGSSQKFIIDGVAAVTINPVTGNLIQTNPL